MADKICQDYFKILQTVLDRGSDPNQVDLNGFTPMHSIANFYVFNRHLFTKEELNVPLIQFLKDTIKLFIQHGGLIDKAQ